jgi:glycine hydroxymethyltransferase
MKQVIVDKKDAAEIAAHVKEFKTDFKKTQYCFDNKLGAYEYEKLR